MKEHASRNPASQAKKKAGFFNKKGPGTFFGPAAAPAPFFQPKLTVGEPNDVYEKEADATADKVVRRLSAGDDKTPAPSDVQKKCADCEANDQLEKQVQTKPIFDSKADPMEEPLRRKESSSTTPAVTPSVESGLRSSKGGGSPLPASTRKQMESSIGADFSGVRIHNDGNARQMSKDLNAQAFTHGKDIYFNSGKYDPSGTGGKHLLAHELTHVVQQGGGGIKRKPATSPAPRAATPAPATTPAPTAPAPIQRGPDPNDSSGGQPNPGGGSSPGTPDPNNSQSQSNIPGPPYKKDGYTLDPGGKQLRLPKISLPTIKQGHGQEALWTFPRQLKADRDDDQTKVWTDEVTTATTTAVTNYLKDKDTTKPDGIYFLKGIDTNFTLFGTADQLQQLTYIPKWDRKGGPRNHDVDHIVEMQLDGKNDPKNMQLLDASANRSSGSKLHWEIIKRVKAGLKYFNDNKVPNVPKDEEIIGADTPAYNVFFEALDAYNLATGGAGDMYWTIDEIKGATHMQQLRGMTLDEIKKIQGSSTELVLFMRAGGGTPHTFSLPASAQPLVPGVDVTAVNVTNQSAGSGQQMGNIQVTLKPSLQKKFDLKDPITINFNKVAGLANAGTLDLTGLNKGLAYKLRFTGLSPVTVNNLDLGDEGLVMSGIITADVPLIKDSPIDFSVQGEDIRISKTFNTGEIKGFPKPFVVNDVSLSIFASTQFGFGVEGDINFAIQGLGKGSVTGLGATSSGFGVKGEFAFDSKKFQGSKINFSYLQQQWTVGGTLIIPQGSGIKGVDSAKMTVSYAAEKITADGSVVLSVPGIDKATLHAEFQDGGAFTIGGSVDLKAMPGIKSGGKVTAQISKAAGGADYSLSISGEVEPNLPNIPKLNPKLTVSYIDGLFKAEGKMDFGTSGGMITGDVTVGVTNGTVTDGVLQGGGEGGKNISVYGKGTLHFIPFKGVDAAITVKVNTDGKALFSFSLDAKVTPFDPIEKSIPILDVSQDIPLVGVPFLSLNLHIGFHARLDIKWLPLTIGVKASMTDKSYDDLIGGKFDSDFALTVETSGSVALVIGVEAGVSVTVTVFVGGATLNGDVTLQANAALKGELDAGWGGEQGLKLKGGKGTAQADLQLILGLSGRAFVDVDLLFTKKNVWEKKWDLAKSDPKTLYQLGIEAPFEFDDNNNLKPFDPKQITFNPPLDSSTASQQGNKAVNPDGANQAQKPDDDKVKNDLRQEIKTEMRDASKDASRDMDAFAADLTTKLTASNDPGLGGFVKQTIQDELNAIKAEKSSSNPEDPSSVSRKPMNGSPDMIQLQPAGGGTPSGDAKQANPSAKSAGGASPAKPGKEPGKPDFNLHLLMTLPNDNPKPDYSKGSKQLGVWENADLHFNVKHFALCDSIQKGGKDSSFVTDIAFELTDPVFIFEIANEISRGMTGDLDVDEIPGVTDPTSKQTRILFHQINQRIVIHSKQHFDQYRQIIVEEEKLIRKKLAELPGKSKPRKMAKKDLESYVNSMLEFLIADLRFKLWKKACEHEKHDYPTLLKGLDVVAMFMVKCPPQPKQLAEPLLVTVPGKAEPVKKDKPPVQRKPEDDDTSTPSQDAPQGQPAPQGQGQPVLQDQPQQGPEQPQKQGPEQPQKQSPGQAPKQTAPDQSSQPAGQSQSAPGKVAPSPTAPPAKNAASPGNAASSLTPSPVKQSTRSSVLTSINASAASPALMGILQSIDNEQQKLTANGEQRKLQIMAAAQAQKLAIRDTIHTQATRLEQVFEDAIAAINTAVTDARVGMITEREKKIAEVQLHGNVQIAALAQSTDAHRDAISTAAETTAAAAEKTGETQAQRVLADTSQKAGQAITIGENTIPKYKSYDRSARIGSALRDISTDLASNYIDVGKELAKAARKDAADMAGKFRGESVQSMEHFMVAESTGMSKIAEQRDQTVTGLTQLTQDPITQLDQTATDLIMQLSTQRVDAVLQVLQSNTGIEAAIDQQSAQATTIVDKQTHEAGDRLTDFGVQLYKSFGQEAPSPKQIAEVNKLVGEATAKFANALDKFTSDVDQSLVAGSGKIAKDIDAQVTATAAPVQQTRQGFGNTVANVSGQVAQAINDTVLKAEQNMDTVVTETEKTYQDSVDKSTAEWNDELVKGSAEIISRMDTGLSKLDETLAKLPSQLSEKAEDIEHEGILHRIGSWVAGFVVGLVEEAVDFVLGLAAILLIIIAILVIAAVLVALFLGLDVLIAAIVAIGAAIAAAAEVIAAILEVAAGIAFLVGLYVGIKYIYLSITRPDLSDYERGKLAGRGVFQIGLAVFGEKIFGKLGEWVKSLGPEGRAAKNLARLKELITDEQQLERMMVLFGKDTGRLEKALAAFGDDSARLDKALTAFGSDAGKLEQALKTFGGNGARLEKALGAFSDDSAALGKALTSYGNDAGQLEKALTTFGEDGARLNKALAAFGNDAARMEKALTAFGEDTARMEKALGRFGDNGADLERALDKCGGNGARLEALLDNPKISDTKQLLSLLDDYGATQLEELLKISTVPNGAQLERMAKVFKDVGFGNGLTGALQTDQLGRLASPGILDELEKAAALQGAGKVTGVQDWIKFNAPKGLDELQDTVGELREAERQAAQADPGSTIGVGAESNAPPRPGAPNEKAKSFDLEVKDSTGKVTGSTEFKRLETPVEKVENLRDSVRHGADKAAERAAEGIPIEGTLETTIQMTLDVGIRPAGPNSIEILADGTRNIIRADTGAIAKTTNIFDDFAKFLSGVENNGYLNVVNLVDDTGKLIASYQRTGAVWVRIF
jgi:hypothetical protein